MTDRAFSEGGLTPVGIMDKMIQDLPDIIKACPEKYEFIVSLDIAQGLSIYAKAVSGSNELHIMKKGDTFTWKGYNCRIPT